MSKKQHLSESGTKRLLKLGLTEEYIFWVNQCFPLIVEDLRQPAPYRAVRKELQKISGYLAKIDDWCEQAKNSTLRQEEKVAFGHIGLAAADWKCKQMTDLGCPEDAIPERMDLQVMANSFRQIVKMAEMHFPPHMKQPRRSAIGVIERIEAAINRPQDEESLKVAKNFQLLGKLNPQFFDLAEIIFEEAQGDTKLSPEFAIRELLKRGSQSKLAD